MFTPLQGLRVSRRAIAIGVVLSGVTATAVGAASGHAPWSVPLRPTLAAQTSEPRHDATTTVPATTEPPTIAPVVLEPVATQPPPVQSTTTLDAPHYEPPAPIVPPAAAPVTTPAPVEPVAVEPVTTEQTAVEPTTPVPTPALAPAPASTPEAHPNDNVVPASLQLSCAASDAHITPVTCSWTGAVPAGFATFALLRSDPDGKGRTPYQSADATTTTFVDGTPSAGNHGYVLVVMDAAKHAMAHSNMVRIQINAA